MIETVTSAVLNTQNIAIIVMFLFCVGASWFIVQARKEDREDRAKRDHATNEERREMYALVRMNTDAINALRNTLSAINGKVF